MTTTTTTPLEVIIDLDTPATCAICGGNIPADYESPDDRGRLRFCAHCTNVDNTNVDPSWHTRLDEEFLA